MKLSTKYNLSKDVKFYSFILSLVLIYLLFAQSSKLMDEPEHLGQILYITLDVLLKLQTDKHEPIATC